MVCKKIHWFGTNDKKLVRQILKVGFREGVQVFSSFQNAIEFGGKYVIAVLLDKDTIDGWTAFIKKATPSDKILFATKVKLTRIYSNEKLMKEYFGVE